MLNEWLPKSGEIFEYLKFRIHRLALVQILFDPLRFAQQEGGLFLGNFYEFLQDFHRCDKVFSELQLLLILPSAA